MSELKEAANKSFADGKIVSCKRITEKYGKDFSAHIILNIGIVPDGENPVDHAIYYAVEPFWLGVGSEWDMWDEVEKCFKPTKVTAEISNKKLEEFLKKVPGANDCEDVKSALEWLVSDESHDAKVRAQFINRPYTDNATGEQKIDHVARLYEVNDAGQSAEDIMSSFGKQMAVCRVKFGGKKNSIVAKAKAKKPVPPPVAAKVPAMPPPVAKAETAALTSTKENVWGFYEANLLRTDPSASLYWERVEEAVGKPVADCDKYTPEDWGKALSKFEEAAGVPF